MQEEIVIREKRLVEELGATNAMRAYLRSGDLSSLPEAEKDKVLIKMCAHYDLDPILRPFILLTLNGKQVWYPTKAATDQVAAKFNLTREVIEIKENVERGVIECRVKITAPGCERSETCIAAVSITEFQRDSSGKVAPQLMRGETYANALMKVESKAKRRATLGWLGIAESYEAGEFEIEKISEPQPITIEAETQDKKRGRPSRAEIEAKSMSSEPEKKEPERIHLKEQVEAAATIETKPTPELKRAPNGKFAPKAKEPEPLPEIEEKKESAVLPPTPNDNVGKETNITLELHNNMPQKEYVKYSRENDNHKHLMRLTLEQCGIDWKKPDHVKLATKVSLAANGNAPLMDGENQFAKDVFTSWIKAEIKRIQDEVDPL